MLVTWGEVERRAAQAMNASVRDSTQFARQTFQGKYASSAPPGVYHHQLLSPASYRITTSFTGMSATGIVSPIASPQPSYFGMATIPESLAYMFEVGGRFNLRTRQKDPAVPVRASVQEQTNKHFRDSLATNFIKQGFSV